MGKRKHSGRTDLRKAAVKRRADAWALLDAQGLHPYGGGLRPRRRVDLALDVRGRHACGASYLGGYAVECKLKAIAMEVYECWTLDQLAKKWDVDERDVYSYGLEALAKRLPLYRRLRESDVWRDFAGHVNRWRVHWRYDPRDWSYEKARAFMKAVDRVSRWLDSNRC